MQYSTLIVNYNAGPHLAQAVKSVLSIKDCEVIVVDNASTDGSIKTLQKINNSRLKIIQNQQNLGFAKAVNQGSQAAHGQYLLLLNPDAKLGPGALTIMRETAKSYNDNAIIAPALINEDGTFQPSCYREQSVGNAIREFWGGVVGSYSKYLPRVTRPTPVEIAVAAAWLIPINVWKKLGGLSEKYFLYFEDLDFCDQARHLGIRIVYDPTARVYHTHGVSAISNPATNTLFVNSANLYHGRLKKLLIDLIIKTGSLLRGASTPKKALFIWGFVALTTMIIAVLGYLLLPMRYSPISFIPSVYQHNFLLWSWANFDGEHYLSIAKDGYQTYKGQSQYAFFPLLPSMINLLARLGLDLYLSARLITLGASLLSVIALAKWANLYTKKSLESVWTYLLSSGGVFLFAVYTEPVFVALAALTFLFVEQKNWGRAILTTALATATRINGVFLVLFLFASLYRAKKPLSQLLTSALLGASGMLTYMAYLYVETGSALSWYNAQSGWGKAQVAPLWVTAYRYLLTVTTEFTPDLTHLVVVVEVLTTLTLIFLLIKALQTKLFPYSYNLYLLGNLFLPLITGSLGSMPRFALTLFPLYLVVPNLPVWSGRLIRLSFLIFWILGIILFTRGYWYA